MNAQEPNKERTASGILPPDWPATLGAPSDEEYARLSPEEQSEWRRKVAREAITYLYYAFREYEAGLRLDFPEELAEKLRNGNAQEPKGEG